MATKEELLKNLKSMEQKYQENNNPEVPEPSSSIARKLMYNPYQDQKLIDMVQKQKYSPDISALRERTFGGEAPEYVPTETTSTTAKNVAYLEGASEEKTRKNTTPDSEPMLDAPLYQPNPSSKRFSSKEKPLVSSDTEYKYWAEDPVNNKKLKGWMNIESAGLSPDDYTGYVMAANQETPDPKAVRALETEMGFVPTEREHMDLLLLRDRLESQGQLKSFISDYDRIMKQEK